MRDVWKCFLTGILCLWLLADAAKLYSPAAGTREGALKEEKEITDREYFKRKDSAGEEIRIYLNKNQEVDVQIEWIAKGCILLLFFCVIKRAH